MKQITPEEKQQRMIKLLLLYCVILGAVLLWLVVAENNSAQNSFNKLAIFPVEQVTAPTTEYLININTATLAQLKQLSGVGDVIAQAIIDYREENGYFSSIEGILNVKGVGQSTFEKLKDFICV